MDRKENLFIATLLILFVMVLTAQVAINGTTGNAILNFGSHFTQLGYGDGGGGDDDGGDGGDIDNEEDQQDCYEEEDGYGGSTTICEDNPIDPDNPDDDKKDTPEDKYYISCSDPDGGLNFFKKGVLNLEYNTGEKKVSDPDYCQDDSILIERVCSGNQPGTKLTSCEFGCSEGICNQASSIADPIGTSSSPYFAGSGGGGAGSSGSGGAGSGGGGGGALGILTGPLTCGKFTLETPSNAIANSQSSDFKASNAIDGDISTSWFGLINESYPKIIEFNFKSQKCIDYVNLYFNKEDIPMNVDIQISNDQENWDSVISNLHITWPRLIHQDLPGITVARYLRIVQNSGERDFGNLAEIEVKMAGLVRG